MIKFSISHKELISKYPEDLAEYALASLIYEKLKEKGIKEPKLGTNPQKYANKLMEKFKISWQENFRTCAMEYIFEKKT